MGKQRWVINPGDRFGRGIVIRETRVPGTGRHKTNRAVTLRCDCGTEYTTRLQDLVPVAPRSTKSCGCLRREVASATMSRPENLERLAAYARSPEGRAKSSATNVLHKTSHGRANTPLYGTWANMMTRCCNPNFRQFKDYGGRGIAVCERWHDPQLFIEDIEQLIGPRPPGMTLDRIDNDGDYEPGNVRWATRAVQNTNTRVPRDGTRSGALYVCWWRLTHICPGEMHPPWLDWPGFRDDIPRLLGRRPPGQRFHRIDGQRPYEPGNVAWVTPAEQIRRAQEARWRR